MERTSKRGFRFMDAASALVALMRNPDDTKQVFRLFDALASGTPAFFKAKFQASKTGAALLEQKPDILPILKDKKALAALPAGSLGQAYLAFMQRDDLTADFLMQASAVVPHGARGDAVGDFIENRMRDTHDLWHVVTGYGGDLLGEAALLAFTLAQTRSVGIGVLVGVGMVKADDPDARRLMLDAFARGVRAAWLPAVQWEQLLAEDLEDVRRRLRVGAIPVYDPFYARDLPPGGLFAKAA